MFLVMLLIIIIIIIIITNSYNANILVSTLSTGAGNLHRYDANFIYK